MITDDAGFAELASLITRKVGVTLGAYKDKCLRRRIAVRMRACGVHTFADYGEVLRHRPEESERLKDALTINVTRFYRNRETWDVLRSRFLADLWQQRQGRLDVWSAGCSSGEEPYTIAMCVAALCDDHRRGSWLDRLTVHATDIDRESLAQAQAAVYRPEAFQETPAEFVARYTVATDNGVGIAPALRRRVDVRRFDLIREPAPVSAYDVVFCRNVVIYFDRPTQEQLFAAFAGALRPGGLLVLGKVETLLGPGRERLELADARERIYRLPG